MNVDIQAVLSVGFVILVLGVGYYFVKRHDSNTTGSNTTPTGNPSKGTGGHVGENDPN